MADNAKIELIQSLPFQKRNLHRPGGKRVGINIKRGADVKRGRGANSEGFDYTQGLGGRRG